MKKFIAMLMIFSSIFSMQVSASTLATKWDDGVHGTGKVYVTTNDYTIIDNRAYVDVGAVKNSLYNLFVSTDENDYAENYSWNLSFNPDTKQLTIANYMFISSSRMYTAVFQANNPYYVLSGTGDDTVTTYNAGLSPKIIDGHFCIPASSLAKLPNVENMRFDANSKTVNFTFNLDW